MEAILFQALNWKLIYPTHDSWLQLYLQVMKNPGLKASSSLECSELNADPMQELKLNHLLDLI